MSYKINEVDYQQFISRVPNNKVDLIWCDIIANLPDNLKKEAKEKGYKLVKKVDRHSVILLAIEVHDASVQRRGKLRNLNEVTLKRLK